MRNSGTKIVFFGNERLVSGLAHTDAPILRRLIAEGYAIVCVVASHADGVSRKNRELEVAAVAREHGIPVLLPRRVGDAADEIAAYGAEAAVLVAYGQIIPQSVIGLFPKGIINLHPSLLPHYRGPTPIETAIVQGDTEIGISVMRLAAKMDAGPVYTQRTVAIGPRDTKFDVYDAVVRIGADLLSDVLPSILDGSLEPTPQDGGDATYCHLLTRHDGLLDTHILTADQADRRIRAYLGFPKSKLTDGGHEIVITRARSTRPLAGGLNVPFADDTNLLIDELIAPSGKKMTGADFLRGYGGK